MVAVTAQLISVSNYYDIILGFREGYAFPDVILEHLDTSARQRVATQVDFFA